LISHFACVFFPQLNIPPFFRLQKALKIEQGKEEGTAGEESADKTDDTVQNTDQTESEVILTTPYLTDASEIVAQITNLKK
jgi:hypothetical protein